MKQKQYNNLPEYSIPVVELKSNKYQPNRKELQEKIKIDTTPERLAIAIGSQVNLKFID